MTNPLPASGETVVYHTPDGAPYVICNSTKAFVNPTSLKPAVSCDELNQRLNLDLGQRVLSRNNKLGATLLWVFRWLDILLVEWWEAWFFHFWTEVVPIQFKRAVTKAGWSLFLAVHKFVLGRSTGLHPSQSLEYHALTTLMFPSQFLAWTPRRMRFFLKEVYASAPNDPPSPSRIQVIGQDMNIHPNSSMSMSIPAEQATHGTAQGWYIRHHNNNNNNNNPSSTSTSNKGVIFWIYGGAYLSGDVRGNSSVADWMGQQTQMDVFIPQFRLAPEANLFDVLWDNCLAYHWLQLYLKEQRNSNTNTKQQQATPIYVMGVSSGAAIAVRLLQLIAQQQQKRDLDVPDYFVPLVRQLTMPTGGAVLFNPYVDYEQLYPHERTGSFLHYARHDLVVNEAVQEYGLPYLKDFIPTLDKDQNDNRTARKRQSPIHQSCQGLPPLCVVASEHEAVYHMTCDLVNRARSEGVPVTLGVWKYMCHVFSILHGFFPEGQISMDFVVEWVNERQQKLQQE